MPIVLSNHQLREALRFYVEEYSAERNFSPKTRKNKREFQHRLLRCLGNNPLTLENCRLYLQRLRESGCGVDKAKSKPWSSNSLKDETKLIKAFTKFLFTRKHIKEDFGKEIDLPKVTRKQPRLVSPQQAYEIIIEGTEVGAGDNSIHKRIKASTREGLIFILSTGLRITELKNLKKCHFING